MNTHIKFELPEDLCAVEPAESRGLSRDDVRLLVIDRSNNQYKHAHFNDLSQFLKRSDLLVFNRSRTLPALMHGIDEESGNSIQLRLAEHLPDDSWLALLVCTAPTGEPQGFVCGLKEGMKISFSENTKAQVLARDKNISRLWRLKFEDSNAALIEKLYKIGRPIRYEYVPQEWPIDFYQNIYASEPGSAEMPSAGRAFTWRMLFDLKKKGIKSTSIVLHTGLSSYLDDDLDARHPASEEELSIGQQAADAINKARMAGGRVIAVGTTVVRALESASDEQGFVKPQHSYTRLRIDSNHKLKCASGLVTGMHEPEASHLDMLSAFVNNDCLFSAYQSAIEKRYLWHEFGDLNLIG